MINLLFDGIYSVYFSILEIISFSWMFSPLAIH